MFIQLNCNGVLWMNTSAYRQYKIVLQKLTIAVLLSNHELRECNNELRTCKKVAPDWYI